MAIDSIFIGKWASHILIQGLGILFFVMMSIVFKDHLNRYCCR